MIRVSATTREEWEQLSAASFAPLRVHGPDLLHVSLQPVDFGGGISAARIIADRSEMRGGGRDADLDSGPSLFVTLQRSGRFDVKQNDRIAAPAAGDLVMYRSIDEFRLRCLDTTECITVRVPVVRLRHRERDLESLVARSVGGDDAMVRVLRAVLAEAISSSDALTPNGAATVGETTAGLVDAVIDSIHGEATLHHGPSAMLRLARMFVDDHLIDPTLAPETIARHLAISTRYLSSLFSDAGLKPPAAYIREARLRKAASRLITTSMGIAEIGYSVGFGDVATFTRAFKRRHDVSPRDWRRSSVPILPEDDSRIV